ncbi:MAG: 2-dehydropantoate 2-reductase [bacterium]|nr:MAG: 2-dehydropantoate 2-reductase [bacterium]
MDQRKVGVIGAGAIGCVLAAKLSQAGHDVYVVDVKKEIADALNSDGIHLSGIMELDSRVTKALTSIGQLKQYDIDHIFICTKAYVLPLILGDLSGLDNGKTSFVCFQNGLDLLEILALRIDSRYIFRGAVNYAGMIAKPGYVDVTFFHAPNYIGCHRGAGGEAIAKAKEIASLLTDSGLETEYASDIQKRVWQKVILNSALMLTSVLTRLPMNQIMEIPETREVIESHLDECLEVAKAEGYDFGDDFRDKALQYLSKAGAHKTSMLLDFEMGNPIEVDFLNAKIQEHGEKHGLACKQNKLMLALVKGLLKHRNSNK